MFRGSPNAEQSSSHIRYLNTVTAVGYRGTVVQPEVAGNDLLVTQGNHSKANLSEYLDLFRGRVSRLVKALIQA